MIHHPVVVNEGRTIRNPYQFVPFLFSIGKGIQPIEKPTISGFVLFLFRASPQDVSRFPRWILLGIFRIALRVAGFRLAT
ncbi:hypothetical protein [Mesorhizobium sp.]|uniref:hypothetical protein n=1 Tax=Mesorhizobium sp. TaxID=1871066 RepID=UPI001214241E|nr:hypothetical protein [Mesorhizobium sp.]TIL33880.1 MAG: hypothetical protein E5Y85_11805 [Mesorhizobium sp.]TIL54448.1 MAG: hypothetical protein E5Y83_03185 [Mesorhizobium sp.]